jgi:hypothetical protein
VFECQLELPLPEQAGKLKISVKHGIRKSDKKAILVLDLTARGSGKPTSLSMDEWFDIAHKTIVSGFADVTTDDAHAVWRRTR